jgi:ABC-2 type transport system permease protein
MKLIRALDLYTHLIRLQLQSMMEYRATFLLGALAQAVGNAAGVFLLWVMVDRFNGIAGWQAYETAFFWSLNLFSYSLAGIFCLNSFYGLGRMIRSGEFDNVLTKPVNPFLFLAFRQFNYGYFSHLMLFGALIAFTMHRIGIPFTFYNLAFLALTLASGALIYAAVFVATGAPALWLVRSEAIGIILLWEVSQFVRYPLSAFQRSIQLGFTFALPYGFVSYYPAQHLLHHKDFLGFPPAIQYLSPLVGALCLFLAYRFWFYGLTRYNSTGS